MMPHLVKRFISATFLPCYHPVTPPFPLCSFLRRYHGTVTTQQQHQHQDGKTYNNNNKEFNTTTTTRRRNPVFASVLREGMSLLHESIEIIQNSSISRQPFRIYEDESQQHQHHNNDHDSSSSSSSLGKIDERMHSPKYQYTLYHVRAAALQCLETNVLVLQQENKTVGEWSVKGEPVDIVHIRLSSSLQHVTLYWTIPYSLWLLEERPKNHMDKTTHTSAQQQQQQHEKAIDHVLNLQEILNKQWTTGKSNNNAASKMASSIRRYLITNNKWARTPSIRLEPATPTMLYDLLYS